MDIIKTDCGKIKVNKEDFRAWVGLLLSQLGADPDRMDRLVITTDGQAASVFVNDTYFGTITLDD